MVAQSRDWQKMHMQDVMLEFYDGLHATPKPTEEGPVFLGIKNITKDGRLDLSDVRHIAEEDYAHWIKRVTPRTGDIVFSYEATLHLYAIIPEGFRGCLGRRLALIRPNPEVVDTRFLFYYFFGKEWRKTASKYQISGSTVDRIPLITFPKFEVALPPLPTQRRIAAILSAYDDLIENNTRRIKILEEMAQLLYREWFVHFRFPGHERVKMVKGVPEGWEVKRFSDLVQINPPIKVSKDEEYPFVEMAGLSTSSMVIECEEIRKGGSGGSKFQNDDTLFPRITPSVENGKGGFVQFLPGGGVGLGSTEFIVFRSVELCPEYVFVLSRMPDFRENAAQSMMGASGRQRVQNQCFDTYRVAKPPRPLLDKFSETISPMFKLVQTLADKNANLRQTRDLLLPRLVSGEVEVSGVSTDGQRING